jgi:hypothetical protein
VKVGGCFRGIKYNFPKRKRVILHVTLILSPPHTKLKVDSFVFLKNPTKNHIFISQLFGNIDMIVLSNYS